MSQTYKKYSFFIFIMNLSLLSVGCDRLCKKNIQDYATVQNSTGRALTLSFCKSGGYGEVQVALDASVVAQQLALGSHEESEVKGGADTCGGVSDSSREMAIALSPNSFGTVKLCSSQTEQPSLIIETFQTCPSGYLEQTSTGSCSIF